MPQRDRIDIEKALEYKGFKNRGGDHEFYVYHTLSGKKTIIKTKISRGSGYKVYTTPLISAMAKQCRLTNGNFLKLVDCNLSQIDYESILSRTIPNLLI